MIVMIPREELVCLDDPTSYGGGNPPCPNQRRREAERSQLRRLRRRVKQGLEKRSTPETNVGIAQVSLIWNRRRHLESK